MKKALTGFAYDVDMLCGRMNSGLGVFAIVVLGCLVAALGLVRAQQYLPTMMDGAASSYELTEE
jgi:hypothetical protein